MDEFREWLSDYLRYFMLGGAVLLVLIVIVIGARACSGGKKSSDASGTVVPEQVSTEETSSTEAVEEEIIDNPLVEANADIVALIERYYDALGKKDVDTLKEIEVNFAPADEATVTNAKDYIESYQVNKVYTKDGLMDGTYVAYVNFQYKCKDIETAVPAMSSMYIVTDTDGTYKIQGSDTDLKEIKDYMTSLEKDSDFVELAKDIQAANDAAKSSDPDLASFLNDLGNEATSEDEQTESSETTESSEETTEEEGNYMVANDAANVRDAAGGENIIGGVDSGSRVKVLGQEGEWYQVEIDGNVGYIYADLLSAE